MNRGLFITFEGIEGCGKSTQARMLKEYLIKTGKRVFLTREPGGPKIAEEIRKMLLSINNKEMLPQTEVLLYMASRSQHTGEWIIPELEKGKIVISDRYYDSTFAYQGAARKIDGKLIDIIRRYATFGLVPDITFLVDLPEDIGLSRILAKDADRLEQESMEFHKRVRNGFLDLAKKEPERFVVLDGNKSIKEIHYDIINSINKELNK
ncbi:MAG: dTMP kinase [Candidatus Tenebribacter burtonii]|jgi:dTMP kinase|nr:dTMP kinase [Candidatus Tenebribacter burtonii]